MSNDLTSNPMYVDTAAALWTDGRKLKAIAWLNDSANPIDADDDLLVSKASGAVILSKRAAYDGDGVEMYHFPADFRPTGVTITTIDNGHLHVWY